MNIVRPDATEIYNKDPMKHIELIGRKCYKSEGAISEGSAARFVGKMFENRHFAMLEHFRFIVEIPKYLYDNIMYMNGEVLRYIDDTVYTVDLAYIKATHVGDKYKMSFSARGIYEIYAALHDKTIHTMIRPGPTDDVSNFYIAVTAIIKHIIWHYGCDELFGKQITPCSNDTIRIVEQDELHGAEYMVHGWHSVLFICDRGVSHEFVRHRDASFAQESTRYCNYASEKFGHDITVVETPFYDRTVNERDIWRNTIRTCEEAYIDLTENGSLAQEARSVLPNSLKTELVITATTNEWKHIVDLRYSGKTGKPHPQMKEVMGIAVDRYEWLRNLA